MESIRHAALDAQEEAVSFFREILRIPSFSGRETHVVEAIRRRMLSLNYDEVRVDAFGNVLGRVGHGPRVLAFDAHVDTVEVGDSRLWAVDPFGAEVHDGVIYGRGASDQKGGMAALVYAGALMKRLGLLHRWTVWIVGSVLEEDCDGLCWHYMLSEGVLRPEAVVLTEPTELQVYRGHRGRMEIEITTRGLSCHGSAPERGVNAIYKMAPVVRGIEALQGTLRSDPFLGAGSVTVSEVRSTAPSLCAVADSCTIHLDRRLTAGESDAGALDEIQRVLAAAGQAEAEVEVPEFRRASHTGVVYPMRQYFPAWALDEESPLLQAAVQAREALLGRPSKPGRWTFSTNGVGTMGLHGLPTLGFGPGSEAHAHAPTDQCPVDDIGKAMAFYAALVARLETEE
jgi:putative selenium metabolism hydrolase